jgi:hypothetical protein
MRGVGPAWACAALAVAAFFLPWLRLEVAPEARLGELLGDGGGRVTATVRLGRRTIAGTLPTLQDVPRSVSGFDVPRIIRQEKARLALALAEAVTGTPRHLALKSWFVYLVPGVALACGGVLAGARRPVPAVAVAALCAGAAAAGAWRLATLPTSSVAELTIGPGLWLSVAAYAGLAAAAGWRAFSCTRRAG